MLASLLYGAAFVLVAWYQNLPALLGAIILLGISDSFGQPIQGSYYTELEEVKEFGDDRSVSVYTCLRTQLRQPDRSCSVISSSME